MSDFWLTLLNVGRNRRRTALLLLIMTTGTAGLIVNNGLVTYIFNGLRDVAIYGRYGHVQLYRQGYKLNHQKWPLEYWIPNSEYEAIESKLRQMPHVRSVTPESTLPVFITWGTRNAAGLATGTRPSDIGVLTGTRLIAGQDVVRDAGSYAEAVMGRGLAEKLQLHVGDVLTLSASNSAYGYNAMDVRVNGIFEEGFRDYDDWTLKLPLSALQRLSGRSGTEKIILILDNTAETERVQGQVESVLKQSGFAIETATWRDLAEFYRQVVAMFGKELNVIQWIIQVLVFLSLITALTMVYTERQQEMGTLLAMGMTRIRLAFLFAQESIWFGLIAGILGAAIGVLSAMAISYVGISMPPPPGSTRGFIAQIDISPFAISHYALLTFAVASVAGVVPAVWIWRLEIAKTLRQPG